MLLIELIRTLLKLRRNALFGTTIEDFIEWSVRPERFVALARLVLRRVERGETELDPQSIMEYYEADDNDFARFAAYVLHHAGYRAYLVEHDDDVLTCVLMLKEGKYLEITWDGVKKRKSVEYDGKWTVRTWDGTPLLVNGSIYIMGW